MCILLLREAFRSKRVVGVKEMDNKKNKIIKWWIIYGLIWGCIVIIISLLGEDKEISYMPIRIRYMQNMMDFFNGKSELWELRSHNASYYFYLAIFAKCFNIQSPEKVFLIVQTLAAGINVVFYPIIFYYLFEYNKWIAMFSPVFWLLCEQCHGDWRNKNRKRTPFI